MKRISIVLLSLTVLTAPKSFAQSKEATGVRFGLKAGINLANITTKPSDGTSTGFLPGINGGFFSTIPIAVGFAIQPELTYSGLGAKDKESSDKVNLSYLTLPVLAKYSFANSGFGAYLGPQIGYLFSAKQKSEGTSEDIKDGFKSTDLSGIFGIEYFSPIGIGLSARYQLGLSNIVKDNELGASVKNKAIIFSVGYRF